MPKNYHTSPWMQQLFHKPCFPFTILLCLLAFSFFPIRASVSVPSPALFSFFDPFIYYSLSSSSFSVWAIEHWWHWGKTSHSDGGNINQVMHIRETDTMEEERSLFTCFHLIALSLFPRLFCYSMFIYHSAVKPELHCFTVQFSFLSHLSLYCSCSLLLMSYPCQSCL